MTTPLTVVMPAYNAEQYIDAAVQSILAQTHREFQLLVLDDGSTDGTPDRISHWAQQDSRVRHIREESNHGVIAMLNKGLELADTTWIARMDADDLCSPRRFAAQAEYQKAHPHLAVFSTQGTLFGEAAGPIRYPIGEAGVMARLPFDTPVLHAAAWLNRDFLRKNDIRYNPSMYAAEDYGLWASVAMAGGLLSNMAEDLYSYRIHSASMSQSKRVAQEKTACQIRYTLLEKQGCPVYMQERGVLEQQQFKSMAEVDCYTIDVLRTLGERVVSIPALAPLSSRARDYEVSRFLVSALPRPKSAWDKARLLWALAQISPRLASSFVPMYLKYR